MMEDSYEDRFDDTPEPWYCPTCDEVFELGTECPCPEDILNLPELVSFDEEDIPF